MKASRAQIYRAWGTEQARLVLLYGPDESGSREIARALCAAIPDAERTDLTGAELRGDPARLTDEAAAMSLFGERRVIRVDPAGDEAVPAIEALLQAPASANPVIVVAGALRKDSRLLKRALADPLALVLASYVPDSGDADRIASGLARDMGIRMRPDIAHRLAAASGGDRAVLSREIEKFALFLDAAPDHVVDLDEAAFDALQADSADGDIAALVDAVLLGRGADFDTERTRLIAGGSEGITIIRAMLRRLQLLVQLRGEVDTGNSIDAVIERAGKSLFWKDKPVVARQLSAWTSTDLATACHRMLAAEQALKSSGAVAVVADQALLTLARAASRHR